MTYNITQRNGQDFAFSLFHAISFAYRKLYKIVMITPIDYKNVAL